MNNGLLKPLFSIFIALLLVGAVLVPVINSYDDSDTLHIFVLAGQSNAAYSDMPVRCNAEDVNDVLDAPSHDLYYYGTEETPIQNGTYVSTNTPPSYDTTFESYSIWSMYRDGSWAIGGEEPTLAKYASEKLGSDILVINTGVNGQTVAQLLPTATNGIYAKNVIDHALDSLDREKYPNIEFSGMVWIQGESDNYNGTPIDDYIEDFNTIKSWYSKEYGIDRFYISKIRPYFGSNATEAQQIIADTSNNVLITDIAQGFTVENGLMTSDNLHYSQDGRNSVGTAVSELINPVANEEIRILSIIPVFVIIALILAFALYVIRFRD